MERNSGSTPFKIRWQKADLLVAPKGTSNSLGSLKKGAVIMITEDNDPYYYKVSLDNGLEGYVYKDAGEKVSGVQPTKMPSLSELGMVTSNGTEGGAAEEAPKSPYTNGRRIPAVTASTQSTNGNGNGRVAPRPVQSSVPPAARVVGAGPGVVVTSAEIAVFDKPGIIGKQIAKVRRGERAALLSDAGFFYQIQLSTGVVGYIPRYAAQQS